MEIKAHNDHHLLAWMNGLRRDLEAIGIAAAPSDKPPDPLAALRAVMEDAARRREEGEAA